MAPPVELITRILTDSWTDFTSTEEHIKTFRNLSLVSKQWSAIIKEVNSMHSMIPLSYNGGQLYTIKSLSSISNPLLSRTLTFRVEYVVMPQRVVIIVCEPSVAVNKGIEYILRKLFYGPNTPRHGVHIFVDYLDDSEVHIPSFWIPPQITQLTFLYRYRSWVFDRLPDRRSRYCDCERPAVDRRVEHLSITGGTSDLMRRLITPLNEWKCLSSLITDVDIDLPVSSGISVIRQNGPWQYEMVEPDLAPRVMFGDQYSRAYWIHRTYIEDYTNREIPMLEQVIPLGSVGYIDPPTRKFIVLFNAIDPGESSTDARLDSIPSLLESGMTKLVANPKHSPGPPWDREYASFDPRPFLTALNQMTSFVPPFILEA
ncbi:hypothetical protein EV421DRAFT_1399537 [Armillaria borealis]|uniref:Uncharacterized protein n=1 Tax=Armillaria borealis TaxID=47425 RepID=A0AA39MX95_9AGAR|nr:hypothetical protein EV421DRAFT_1399537 [Armillaria borealis]